MVEVSKQTKSSRNFILTLNEKCLEYYADIYHYLTTLAGLVYILVTEHLGTDNKHYHIYVQYQNSKKLSIKKLKGAHVEKCYGSAQKNIAYLMAEDDKHREEGVTAVKIDEQGRPNLKGDYSVETLLDIQDKRDLCDYRMYNTWRRLHEEDEADIDVDDIQKDVLVYWIQGPSGVGKTNRAKDIVRENAEKFGRKVNFIKYENSFYLGVGNADVAIYDDFRDSHMKPSEFINLIDYNKHYMNIKGGSKLNKYKLVIITSVQKLNMIYRRMNDLEEPQKQWLRRIKLIDMYPPEQVHIGGYPIGYRTEFNELENYSIECNDGSSVIVDL